MYTAQLCLLLVLAWFHLSVQSKSRQALTARRQQALYAVHIQATDIICPVQNQMIDVEPEHATV